MTYLSLALNSYARRSSRLRATESSNRFRMRRVRGRRTFHPEFRVLQDPVDLRAQAPKLSKVWNGTHIFTWTTKHACARLYHTFLEDDGETDKPAEDEAPNDPPNDVEEPPPNQDLLFPPVPPDRTGPTITTVLVCSGFAYFNFRM
jgi:hypothetical protein